MEEIIHNSIKFKQIKGFPNYYINKYGEIYSTYTKRLLKIQKINFKYSKIKLTKNKISYNFDIHRLLAQTFIPNPKNKFEVNHINGIKDDNRLENLEWVTKSENEKHKYLKLNYSGGMLGKKGKHSPLSKKVNQYDLEGNFIKTWDSMADIQRELQINSSSISQCCNDIIKKSKGYVWKHL